MQVGEGEKNYQHMDGTSVSMVGANERLWGCKLHPLMCL